MIGLVGANGVGKSTLAEKFALGQDIPFVRTTTSQVFKDLGADPAADYSLPERLQIQWAILAALTRQYADASKTKRIWIADRTPIDMAAYMLADVSRNCPLNTSEDVLKYVDECFNVANRFFGVIVLVQPGIQVPVERAGKALGVPAYQEHFNAIAMGLLMDARLPMKQFFLRRNNTDLEARYAALFNACQAALEQQTQLSQANVAVVH